MYCLNETVQEFRELEEKGRSQKIFKKIFPTQPFKQKTHTAVCTSFEMQHGHTDLVSSCSLNCKHSSLHQYTYSSKSSETHAHVPCRIRMKVCAYSSACSTTLGTLLSEKLLCIFFTSSSRLYVIIKHRQLRMASKLQVHNLQVIANPATLHKTLLVASCLIL